jgi:large subunit ribosomal protein L24
MQRLRIGDQVQVIAGNHKGEKGKVTKLDLERGRVVVEGVNLVKRHLRATQERNGGIVQVAAPLAISNVMPLDPETGKPTRVRVELRDGVKTRVAKSGAVLAESAALAAKEQA